MRSTLFLAALAAGAAHAYEKRVYVTDWTTVTVTKTVTAPAVTETVAAVQQNQADTVTLTSTSTPVQAPAPVAETTSLTSDLAKKSTEVVPEPAPTQAAQQEPVSSWSTAWTSTFEAAPATTLQPQPQPSSSSTSTSSAAAATGTSSGVSQEYIEKVLYNHNVHRSNHSVSSLDWHDDLYQAALSLAEKCVYQHDTTIDKDKVSYGQNIGYGTSESQVGVMISNMMYNGEIDFYPTPYGAANPNMDLFDKWGHFSQIVWKGTTHVACATISCGVGKYPKLANVDGGDGVIPFTVCNYSPPGNYKDKYGENVLAPGNAATYSA